MSKTTRLIITVVCKLVLTLVVLVLTFAGVPLAILIVGGAI